MKIKILLSLLIGIIGPYIAMSQHIYETHMKHCETSKFALESKDATAIMNIDSLQKLLISEIDPEVLNKLKGTIKLQIIAYTDNSSCLLSYENDTNMNDDTVNFLKLKDFVDKKLIWDQVYENASALIELKLKKGKVKIKRMGMNANLGWHEIKS